MVRSSPTVVRAHTTPTTGSADTNTTPNWSGPVLLPTFNGAGQELYNFGWVSGVVTVPAVTNPFTVADSSTFWIGLGGFGSTGSCPNISRGLVQCGTQQTAQNFGLNGLGLPVLVFTYTAWSESLPSQCDIQTNDLSVNVNDVVDLWTWLNGSQPSGGTSPFVGRFDALTVWQPPFSGSDISLFGDVNGDGLADFVNLNATGVYAMLTLSTGAGLGAYEQWSTDSTLYANHVGGGGGNTFLADVDADGLADLVQVDASTTYVMLAKPPPTSGFKSAQPWGSGLSGLTGVLAMWMGDVDGDGRADMVFIGANGYPVSVSLSTGTAFGSTLTAGAPALPTGSEGAYAVGDVNGDGCADVLAYGSPSGSARITTSVSFSPCNLATGAFSAWQVALAADFDIDFDGHAEYTVQDVNGDGFGDIVAAAPPGSQGSAIDSYTYVALANGSHGVFDLPAVWNTTNQGPTFMADMNGDGLSDLIFSGSGATPAVEVMTADPNNDAWVQGATSAWFYLWNETQNTMTEYGKTVTAGGASYGDSAEWIMEFPSGYASLADYGAAVMIEPSTEQFESFNGQLAGPWAPPDDCATITGQTPFACTMLSSVGVQGHVTSTAAMSGSSILYEWQDWQ